MFLLKEVQKKIAVQTNNNNTAQLSANTLQTNKENENAKKSDTLINEWPQLLFP